MKQKLFFLFSLLVVTLCCWAQTAADSETDGSFSPLFTEGKAIMHYFDGKNLLTNKSLEGADSSHVMFEIPYRKLEVKGFTILIRLKGVDHEDDIMAEGPCDPFFYCIGSDTLGINLLPLNTESEERYYQLPINWYPISETMREAVIIVTGEVSNENYTHMTLISGTDTISGYTQTFFEEARPGLDEQQTFSFSAQANSIVEVAVYNRLLSQDFLSAFTDRTDFIYKEPKEPKRDLILGLVPRFPYWWTVFPLLLLIIALKKTERKRDSIRNRAVYEESEDKFTPEQVAFIPTGMEIVKSLEQKLETAWEDPSVKWKDRVHWMCANLVGEKWNEAQSLYLRLVREAPRNKFFVDQMNFYGAILNALKTPAPSIIPSVLSIAFFPFFYNIYDNCRQLEDYILWSLPFILSIMLLFMIIKELPEGSAISLKKIKPLDKENVFDHRIFKHMKQSLKGYVGTLGVFVGYTIYGIGWLIITLVEYAASFVYTFKVILVSTGEVVATGTAGYLTGAAASIVYFGLMLVVVALVMKLYIMIAFYPILIGITIGTIYRIIKIRKEYKQLSKM